MGVVRRLRGGSGQMTIELAVAMPVLIIVAAISMNAMTFFSECAMFDRVACEAVRVHATAPAYGQGVDQSVALVEAEIKSQLDAPHLSVSVSHGVVAPDLDAYTATLEFSPTLFGRKASTDVFGVSLPRLKHSVRYVVDGYKPGAVI